ncbi:hypothetical protein ABEW50_28790, partial [Paenibacillus jamilae]
WTHNCGRGVNNPTSYYSAGNSGGGGVAYQRPVNVNRLPAGTGINITKKEMDSFFKSTMNKGLKSKGTGQAANNFRNGSGSGADLANLARNSKKIDGLQGATVSASTVNEAALNFVGTGAKIQKIDGGMWYVSKNGLSRVRTGQKAKGSYEANFEVFSKQGFNEKDKISNFHVEIK